MENNSKKLFLEVDASQIDIKQLLKKDFLELSMRAISSANPNRNNSWFTKESMIKSKDSFINKPIMGYFENGDFVSHNGDWNYDSETEMSYWDTLGKKGERILGLIRESDEINIVEDDKGLSWITFTCALWTQYSFKQVKRLIKDAKRAQRTGESAKNISVEVDITDYEMLDNGVMKINEFNLVGVTILGTRNGVKVEPGIEDAELSVVDIMGKDFYSKQEQTLRLAYEKLNNSIKNKEESQMENEQILNENVQQEALSTKQNVDTNIQLEQTSCEQQAEAGEVCPECGKNPCECEPKNEQEGCGEGEAKNEQLEQQACECGCCEPEPEPDPIHDITWLINDCSWNISSLKQSIEYYEKHDGVEGQQYILAVLGRILERQVESEKELGELLGKIAAGITQVDLDYEAKLSKYSNIGELIEKYEALLVEKDDISAKLSEKTKVADAYEHQDFLTKAKALIASAKLDEATSAKFVESCDKLEIKTLDELKVQVALYAFDSNISNETNGPAFTAPVSVPDVTAAFADNKQSKNKKTDHWSALHEYIGK